MVPGMPLKNANATAGACAAGDLDIQGAGLDAQFAVAEVNRRKRPAQANGDAWNAAVANQQIGSDTDHRDRQVGRFAGDEMGEIVTVGGFEQNSAAPPTRSQVYLASGTSAR